LIHGFIAKSTGPELHNYASQFAKKSKAAFVPYAAKIVRPAGTGYITEASKLATHTLEAFDYGLMGQKGTELN
jgi:hypothetical protein